MNKTQAWWKSARHLHLWTLGTFLQIMITTEVGNPMHSVNSQIAHPVCALHLSSDAPWKAASQRSLYQRERGTYQPQLGMPKTILPLAWEQRILPTMSSEIHETWHQSRHWKTAHAFLSATSRNGRKEWLVYEPITTKSESTSKCPHYSTPFTHRKLCKKPTRKSNTPVDRR